MSTRSSYEARKQARREHFAWFVFGWVLAPCGACSGSGRYDSTGSPLCGTCAGSGRVRVRGPKALAGHDLNIPSGTHIAGRDADRLDYRDPPESPDLSPYPA